MPEANRSSAVMQQRNEPSDSLDDFPTPPWATRALCYKLTQLGLISPGMTCREPAANRGFMVKALEEYFRVVSASDIHDYGVDFPIKDYLAGEELHFDWTITNPPFKLGYEFIEQALDHSDNVAVILRSAFLEGKGRWEKLFQYNRPSYVFQHVERVPMVKGRYDPDAASATAYSWLVWIGHSRGEDTILDWIPPCKKDFVRDGDSLVYGESL